MYEYLKLEFINVGSMFKNSTEVDVSFLMTYYKKEGGHDDFDMETVFIKNSMGMSDMKLVHDNENYKSFFFNIRLTIINNLKDMPFNRLFLFIEIETTCKNVVIDTKRIVNLNDLNMKKIVKGNTYTFIWKYKMERSLEFVSKYIIIPYLLTLMLQLTHTIKSENPQGGYGTWISTGSTFMLTDVALFFTVPHSNKLTGIEKSLFMSLLMKMFITMFAFYDFDIKISNEIDNFSHHSLDAVIFVFMTILLCAHTSYIYHKSIRGINSILVPQYYHTFEYV